MGLGLGLGFEQRVEAVCAVLHGRDNLCVVRVRDSHPRHTLLLVLLLLAGEDGGEEELLQLLVGEVDAQLLEAGGREGRDDGAGE